MTDTTPTAAPSKAIAAEMPYFAFLRTLDGYEEEAIEETFGLDIDSLAFGRQLRALVFISRLRTGSETAAARNEVMTMTVQQIFDEFLDTAQPKDAPAAQPEGEEADAAPAGRRSGLRELVTCGNGEGCQAPVHVSTCPER